jgi:hypothetical protein
MLNRRCIAAGRRDSLLVVDAHSCKLVPDTRATPASESVSRED